MELLPLSRFFSSLAAPNPTVGSLLLGSLQDTVQLLEVAGKLPVTVGVINNVDKPYVPPSRKNRKFFTTWIDEAALKELRDLSHETGRKQQELIAEALNMLFVKHGKRTVAR